MDELDLLKSHWKKNENAFGQVSEKEIYKMLHKKSSGIVKWILIISIAELIVWQAFGLFMNSDEYLREYIGNDGMLYFRIFNWFTYGITLTFIFLFSRNYRRISALASTKQLMADILRTRKTVNYYVWYNLGMIVVCMIIGFVIGFMFNPKIDQMREEMARNGMVLVITLVIIFFFIAVAVGLFWLFYRLVYGILLRKLLANYKELKKIDF